MIDVEKEVRQGLASIFHIVCKNCSTINNVYTSKTHMKHDARDNRSRVYDLNTKGAIGKCYKYNVNLISAM